MNGNSGITVENYIFRCLNAKCVTNSSKSLSLVESIPFYHTSVLLTTHAEFVAKRGKTRKYSIKIQFSFSDVGVRGLPQTISHYAKMSETLHKYT